jgi:hypothetical protein
MKLPHRRQFLHPAAGAAALPAVSRIAQAQSYPSLPVRLIVPLAPGGATDIVARLIGQWLSERLHQPFVIDNLPGGGTNIGTETVVRAASDGYMLLLASTPNTINATLYDKLNYNFIRDMAPVATIAGAPNVRLPQRSRGAYSRPAMRARPPPPTLREGGHRSLACCSIAMRGRAALVVPKANVHIQLGVYA